MQIRDRAKQTAVVVSDTEYTLDAGTAPTGYRLLRTAYEVPTVGALAGTVTWNGVPVLVTTDTGAWQIVSCALQRSGTDVLSLVGGTVISSSTGAALALAATTVVTIEVVASEASFGQFSIQPRTPYTQSADGCDNFTPGAAGTAHPHRDAAALLAIGTGSQATGEASIAIGIDARAAAHNTAIGNGAHAAGVYASVFGGYNAGNGMTGEVASGIGSAFFGAVETTAQHARGSLNGYTTDATPGKLGYSYGATPTLAAESEDFYVDAGITVLDGYISAVDVGTGDAKVWKFHAVWQSTLDFTTATLQDSDFTEVYAAAGAAAWTVSASADSSSYTAGAFNITGEAAKNIAWAASFDAHYHWIYV